MGAIVTADEVRTWADLTVSDLELDPVIDAVEAAAAISHNFGDPPVYGADVKQAIVMQVARLWKRRNTPEGVMSFGPEFGMRVNRFDPDIDELLAPYRRWAIGGRPDVIEEPAP